MWENAYLSIKNPKASRARLRALDPGCKLLASLARLHFATSATFGLRTWAPPLDQILDPHLILVTLKDTFDKTSHNNLSKKIIIYDILLCLNKDVEPLMLLSDLFVQFRRFSPGLLSHLR